MNDTQIEESVKALFFAQYLKKELIVSSVPCNISYPNYPFDIKEGALFLSGVIGNQIIVRRIAEDVKDRFNQTALLLRSIDQLTDEERLQVGIVAFPMFVPFPEKDHDTLRKLSLTVLERGHLGSRTHQTLIRYGVLAPFTYLDKNNKPVTLEPDEIISLGWAKYQQS